jgi:multicomponent Na+:H+ antiporter subunit E
MLHFASLAASLAAFWLLLSGMFTPFLVGAGVLTALAVAALSRRMDLVDHEGHPIHLAWGALMTYWPWLLKEIAKSAWDVSKRVLDPRLPISPTLCRFRPGQRTELGLVIHANSITLTPGTIAVEVAPDEFLVHALTREGADGLAGSEMDFRCTRLEGRP